MRKNKKSFLGLALVLSVLVFWVLTVQADVYMKQKNHTDSLTVMGQTQPAKDETVVTWMAKDKYRTDNGDKSSTIMRLDQGLLYQIDHQKMTYKQRPLNLKATLEENVKGEGKEAEEAAELAQGMAEAMAESMEVKVTETPEKQNIGNWNCRKYIINTKMAMGETTSEAWASPELNMDWKSYLMLSNAMMAGSPGFEKMIEKIGQEMSKIKGVIVKQSNTTKAMGFEVKSTSELLEFGEKTPPAGTYDVPAGYKKVK